MTAAIDANLLLYPSDSSSDFFEPATELLRKLTRGPDILYVFWPVVMAYLRIATHPSIFDSPLSSENATRNVDSLLALSHVRSPSEEAGFWRTFYDTLADADVRGNLVGDAHIVALMRHHGVRDIWTSDRDFRRFDGIRVLDPFAS